MCEKIRLLNVINELHPKPYKLGGNIDDDKCLSLDCMVLIDQYLYLISGHRLPRKILGVDYTDYREEYEKDAERLTTIFLGLLRVEFKVFYRWEIVAGDVVWIEHKGERFPGIFVGNNSLLTCFKDTGTTFISMADLYNSIRWVFRWVLH
jgi:hypothetical protein